MIIEFEKRVESISTQLAEAKVSQPVNEKEISKLEGALAEAEHLYAFYKSQMVGKGRIIPHEYKEG